MKSKEWDERGFVKHTNPSSEVIRTKTYVRICPAWDNEKVRSLVARRRQLANLLQVPYYDLLADLEITIKINRYPRHRRFLKFFPRWR